MFKFVWKPSQPLGDHPLTDTLFLYIPWKHKPAQPIGNHPFWPCLWHVISNFVLPSCDCMPFLFIIWTSGLLLRLRPWRLRPFRNPTSQRSSLAMMWSAFHRLRVGSFRAFLCTRSLAWGEDMHTASHSFIWHLKLASAFIDLHSHSGWVLLTFSIQIQIWSFSAPHHAGASSWIFTGTRCSSLLLSGTSTHQNWQQRPASSFYCSDCELASLFPMRWPSDLSMSGSWCDEPSAGERYEGSPWSIQLLYLSLNPLFSVIECVMQKLCEYESIFFNLHAGAVQGCWGGG